MPVFQAFKNFERVNADALQLHKIIISKAITKPSTRQEETFKTISGGSAHCTYAHEALS